MKTHVPDRIFIRDLEVRAIIGVNDDERREAQDVLITVVLDVNTRCAAESDAIEDTVNYATVAKGIIALAEGSRFYLVERLAAEIARLCLEYPGVDAATVRVDKPGAVRQAGSVGVEIRRTHQDA